MKKAKKAARQKAAAEANAGERRQFKAAKPRVVPKRLQG